jgi:hypothetical protein
MGISLYLTALDIEALASLACFNVETLQYPWIAILPSLACHAVKLRLLIGVSDDPRMSSCFSSVTKGSPVAELFRHATECFSASCRRRGEICCG